MGQLDEAIRAHLELKRKHGASEEELHAEEQEALGPVRRETAATSSPPEEQPVDDVSEPEVPAEAPDVYAEPLEDPPAPDLAAEPLEDLPAPDLEADPLEDLPAQDLDVEPLEDLPPEAFHEPVGPLIDAGPPIDPDFAEPHENTEAAQETVEFEEGTEAMEPEEDLDALDPAASSETDAGQTPPRDFEAVEDPPVEGDEEEEEDVLEETPDFLQETPEHDRLWFEQKPPRDFDFDE